MAELSTDAERVAMIVEGDIETYEKRLARTDAEAIAPDSLDLSTVGGWAWWADKLLKAVALAPEEDKHRVAARHLQAIACTVLRGY